MTELILQSLSVICSWQARLDEAEAQAEAMNAAYLSKDQFRYATSGVKQVS